MSNISKLCKLQKKSRNKKVIGYFATYAGSMNVLCDGDACVIGSSREELKEYIKTQSNQNPADYIIKRTTYSEIDQGMKMGGAYAFDQKAYSKFQQLAKQEGKDLAELKTNNDTKPHKNALRLIMVQWFNMA